MARTLSYISEHLSDNITVSITYFKPDNLKKGGAYLTDVGHVKKFDDMDKVLLMDSGMKISMEQIIAVETESRLE